MIFTRNFPDLSQIFLYDFFSYLEQEKENDDKGSGSDAEKKDESGVPPVDENEILPQISDEDSDDDRPRNK